MAWVCGGPWLENVRPWNGLAEVSRNRTDRSRKARPTGFEVPGGHQPTCTSELILENLKGGVNSPWPQRRACICPSDPTAHPPSSGGLLRMTASQKTTKRNWRLFEAVEETKLVDGRSGKIGDRSFVLGWGSLEVKAATPPAGAVTGRGSGAPAAQGSLWSTARRNPPPSSPRHPAPK